VSSEEDEDFLEILGNDNGFPKIAFGMKTGLLSAAVETTTGFATAALSGAAAVDKTGTVETGFSMDKKGPVETG